MKKFGYIVAAIVAIGLAAPSIASAETVVIKHGDRDHDGDLTNEKLSRSHPPEPFGPASIRGRERNASKWSGR